MKRKTMYSMLCILLVASAIFLCYGWFAPVEKANLIKLGYMTTSIDHAPFYVAYTKGFFTEHNVTIETVPFTSSSETRLALSTGQVDVAFAGPVGWFVPISKGLPIKIIAPLATVTSHLYVRPDNKIITFEDFIGKTIAFVSLGSGPEYEIRYILRKENIDATKINFVKMEREYRPIALMEKKVVDAVFIDQSEVPKYSELGAVPHDEWVTKGYDKENKPGTVIAVDENFKNSNPQLVERFIDALIEGRRFIKSNPEEAAEIVSEYIKDESEGAIVYFPENLITIWESGEVKYNLWNDPTIIIDLSKIGVELGQLNSSLSLNQIYDLSYEQKLKDAQDEIYSTD